MLEGKGAGDRNRGAAGGRCSGRSERGVMQLQDSGGQVHRGGDKDRQHADQAREGESKLQCLAQGGGSIATNS